MNPFVKWPIKLFVNLSLSEQPVLFPPSLVMHPRGYCNTGILPVPLPFFFKKNEITRNCSVLALSNRRKLQQLSEGQKYETEGRGQGWLGYIMKP